ncbi:carbon starvation protein A [Escherichia coli]|uniref:Carbon starvation protein A n=1 Tax=Escherichia coli TaxID=562 RepID=A0A376LKK6_ECOLX|nr:carbon starvation protein A [Escherichia coli]
MLAPAGTADVVASAAQVVSSWGFAITPDTLNQIASEVGEQSIISRAGGAPTLAVGMAYILHGALGGMMDVAFWYHFAILFEALFYSDGGGCRYACCALYVAGSAGRGVSGPETDRFTAC